MAVRPLTKVTKTAVLSRVRPLADIVARLPAWAEVERSVRGVKAVKGRGALVDGHDWINAEASVKMAFGERGVPTVAAPAARLRFSRCTPWWIPSVERIAAAAERMALLCRTGAPPRYAETPTPSSTEPRLTTVTTSLRLPKL